MNGNLTIEQAWEGIDYTKNEQDSAQSSATFRYIVSGSQDEKEVVEYARQNVPAVLSEEYGGLPRQTISIAERLTETDWKVEVVYADSGNFGDYENDANEPNYNFEISAGSKRMVYALEHIKSYPSGTDAPQAGINNGEGVEIVIPVGRFSETHFMSQDKVSASYQRKITELVGKINGSAFKGYSKGQVLFMGCSGSRTGKEKWQITFNFAVATAQSGITIGNISGIRKAPWDILWCEYEEDKNEDGSEVVKKVKAVHCERVYEYGNFGGLGI